MIVNDPRTHAEIARLFADYERALVSNDIEALDGFFLGGDTAVRFGAAETLFGIAEIRAFRAARPSKGLARELVRTEISTYGADLAVTAALFRRASAPGKIGRQMQTWVRFPVGWRIVAAHVSLIDEPERA